MIVNKSKSTTTVTKGSVELNAADIIDLVRKVRPDIPTGAGSVSVRVYFAVPGGGDWSNTDVDIDGRNPVRVEWSVEEVIDD